jgi:hypothetical protein
VTSFIEIFAWVMTMPAYQALYELLSPEINPYGWGYDLWYDNYARVNVPGKKLNEKKSQKLFLNYVFFCVCLAFF